MTYCHWAGTTKGAVKTDGKERLKSEEVSLVHETATEYVYRVLIMFHVSVIILFLGTGSSPTSFQNLAYTGILHNGVISQTMGVVTQRPPVIRWPGVPYPRRRSLRGDMQLLEGLSMRRIVGLTATHGHYT